MFLAKNGGKNDELLERIGLFRTKMGIKSPMSVWGAWDLLTEPLIILYSVHYARRRDSEQKSGKVELIINDLSAEFSFLANSDNLLRRGS